MNILSIHSLALEPVNFLQVLEQDSNDFLKTRKGLLYLCIKYPSLTVEQAIKEFKSQFFIANAT